MSFLANKTTRTITIIFRFHHLFVMITSLCTWCFVCHLTIFCRLYTSAVEAIECASPPLHPSAAPNTPPATFGSHSLHLLHPLMLCSTAHAELGDGSAALHRLQAALAIAELLCVCSCAARCRVAG
jgi:hypothetical protein